MGHLHFYPDKNKTLNLRPKLLYTGILSDNPQWFNTKHCHNFCEIMYIDAGEGKALIDHIDYSLKKGDLVIYNPNVWHEEYSNSENPLNIYFFAVDNIKIPGLPDGQLIPDDCSPVTPSGKYDDRLKNYLTILITEEENKPEFYKIITNNLVTLILTYILRLYEIKIENDDVTEACEQAKQYIQESYAENISLDDLSETFHVSKYYFVHIFKEYTGMSPIRYLVNIRMEKAKRLLIETELPIKEIALQVGYDDVLIFSRVFKNNEDLSPTDFRKKYSGEMESQSD